LTFHVPCKTDKVAGESLSEVIRVSKQDQNLGDCPELGGALESSEKGDRAAALHDRLYPRIEAACIDRLRQLAGSGRVLELGVGSGRCAGRLTADGVRVVGVDRSRGMLARAAAKCPGVDLVCADLAQLPFRGGFRLAVSLVDTLSLMPTIDALRNALRKIAEALEPGGTLVDESWRARTSPGAPRRIALSIPISDPDSESGSTLYRVRYWELSQQCFEALCAQAGLFLQARWSTWGFRPVQDGRMPIVSIYSRQLVAPGTG
jgi:SAM-dependent methyltransferase